ncbi:MAG TPA: YihY/virulence factor BrkB family protein [Acidobacteriaceae bacterium]|nr:YihY/virulence factor BrkB family protein [Acidobacteriaceae bacterium]
MRRWLVHIRRTISNSLSHDVLMLARAGAYSAIICIFPIVLVTAAMLASSPAAEVVRAELRSMLYQMFPPDVPPLVLGYFQGQHRSLRLVLTAATVFLLAANSVMTTLMEAMRRAYKIPEGSWSVSRQILVAFVLTFLSFFPLALASIFVVFGHQIELWMIYQSLYDVRPIVLVLARLARWLLALTTSVTVLAIIYHMGTPRTQSWRRVLPGSVLATALWFPSTLTFGWYVTRHAHYRQVYGSLGAGVALLVWLYIIMVSVMIGAEFNAQVFPKQRPASAPSNRQLL